jgi:hypothetical protein
VRPAANQTSCVVTNGNDLVQWGCGGGISRWWLWQASGNQYTIRSESTGGNSCWDVPGSATWTIPLIQYYCWQTANQRFTIYG